jgi:hypothetical protein
MQILTPAVAGLSGRMKNAKPRMQNAKSDAAASLAEAGVAGLSGRMKNAKPRMQNAKSDASGRGHFAFCILGFAFFII